MNENEKVRDEEMTQVSGGNRRETYELGQYLYSKFPEEFPDPDNITLDQVNLCLRHKVPNFNFIGEPGDERSNYYGFYDRREQIRHAELMEILKDRYGE